MSKLRHFKKTTSSPHLLTPDELQISVNKSAEHLRVLWISYSLFAVYLIITSLSVTHRHLFLELPLRLPVLNIDLGLQDFFIAAPILFIGMHLYLVFHVNVLRQQVVKYQDIVRTETTLQEKKSYLFDPFIFVQSWVGHAKGWRSKIGFFIITHGSLKIFPIFVLLLIMLSALPYHDETLTHYHRIMVVMDFTVIAVFAVNWRKKLLHLLRRILITSTTLIVLFISLYGILVFQGEDLYKLREEGFYTQEQPYREQEFPFLNSFIPTLKILSPFLESTIPYLKSRTKILLEGEANYVTGKPESLFSNRLVLVNEDFVDNKILDDVEKRETEKQKISQNFKPEMLLRKRGRHFENAVFDYSNLPRTDFTGAYISGASFASSNLEKSDFSCDDLPPKTDDTLTKQDTSLKGLQPTRTYRVREDNHHIPKINIPNKNVNFSRANLKKSNLKFVNLEDINFEFSQLKGADFYEAQLQNINFEDTKLQNAILERANIQKSNFQNAQLQKANLSGAQFEEINFQGAKLQEANFEYSGFKDANFWLANLQGANLKYTGLQGANFEASSLQGANFDDAELQGAQFSDANLQGANLNIVDLHGANLRGTQLQGTNLENADLLGADLTGANLQGANLQYASLQGTIFSCVNLEMANLQDVNLWNNYLGCPSSKEKKLNFQEKKILLKEINFDDYYDNADLLQSKEYYLEKCQKDPKNTQCKNNIEIWFKSITQPTKEQLAERKKIWEHVHKNSLYRNKTEDKFMQDFWQYRVEELVCKNIVPIGGIIKQIDGEYYYTDKKLIAQLFLAVEQARNCKLNPLLADEQRATLEGWLEMSD